MKMIGIMIMIGIACFWAGRLTTKPEVRTEVIQAEPDKIYDLPDCLEAVCRSLYLVPNCK